MKKSTLIIFLLFLTSLGIGVYLYKTQRNQTVNETLSNHHPSYPTPLLKMNYKNYPSTPEEVVQQFYSRYFAALDYRIRNNDTGMNPYFNLDSNTNPYFTEEFSKKAMGNHASVDFVCASNITENVRTQLLSDNGTVAYVNAIEHFASGDNIVKVEVDKIHTVWKINNAVCPAKPTAKP